MNKITSPIATASLAIAILASGSVSSRSAEPVVGHVYTLNNDGDSNGVVILNRLADGTLGEMTGGVPKRDGGYHQGAVWAWLLGPYAMAEYRVTGDVAAAQARLEPIADHLADAALGQISEIFDGDPPHHPRGAPAQAWSVACILEAWWRLEKAKQSSIGAAALASTAR